MKTPPAQPSVTAKGPLLEAVGLSKSFRPVEVLKDVSLAPGLTGGPSQAQQSTNGHGASPAPERICLRIDSLTMKFVDDAPGTAAFGAKPVVAITGGFDMARAKLFVKYVRTSGSYFTATVYNSNAGYMVVTDFRGGH